MLKFLLDEHISPEVAVGLRRRSRALVAHGLAEWLHGELLGQDDARILSDAFRQGLTLVTYDRRTIPVLLKEWAEVGRQHGGVIFVDDRTISPAEIGGLVRALLELNEKGQRWSWTDRVCYLHR